MPARLLEQKVGRIHGNLIYFNEEMFPHLSGSKSELANQFCVFADRTGKWGDGKTKAYSNYENMILPVQLTDKDGRTWHLAEIIGSGLPTDSVDAHPPACSGMAGTNNPIVYVGEGGFVTHGLLDRRQAEADRDFSLKVREKGGHTTMPFMILEIDKIITETGELKPIKELQEEGKVAKTFWCGVEGKVVPLQPVVYIRLSSEVRSIVDAEKSDFREIAEKNGVSIEAFRRQLTERAAKTLAIIHDFGVSKPTIWHDVHLDGSIVNYHYNIKPDRGDSAHQVVTAVQTICNAMPILKEKYADSQFQASLLLSDENLSKESRANIEAQVRGITSLFLGTYRASRKNMSEGERQEMLKEFKREDTKFTGGIISDVWTVEFVEKPKAEGRAGEKALDDERPNEEKKAKK
jgi:hypothetical protein